MALYRTISISFWTDAKVTDDFTPEDRYFFLYLFTNPHTNLAGCYEVSIRQIANETGYSMETIERLLDRFANVHHVAYYSKETKEVLIANWNKYNWTSSEKYRKPLEKELRAIKQSDFRDYLMEIFNGNQDATLYRYGIGNNGYGIDTPNTSTNTNTVSNSISKPKLSNNPDIEIIDKKDIKIETLCEKRFKQFWELYPRKEGKGAAKKSWEKINPNAELFEKIMSAVRENIEHNPQWQRNNGQYIPHPATWLNQGRWDDDISSVGNSQSIVDRWANVH